MNRIQTIIHQRDQTQHHQQESNHKPPKVNNRNNFSDLKDLTVWLNLAADRLQPWANAIKFSLFQSGRLFHFRLQSNYSHSSCEICWKKTMMLFFILQARATSDRSRQLRRQSRSYTRYSVHKEAWRDSYVSLRKSQLASQVQK